MRFGLTAPDIPYRIATEGNILASGQEKWKGSASCGALGHLAQLVRLRTLVWRRIHAVLAGDSLRHRCQADYGTGTGKPPALPREVCFLLVHARSRLRGLRLRPGR
jgi:hypothetical protein